ncbi:hypothetical protein N7519_004400 [Penicillium mononematosum]|uniref:uncharacterized protein n=1 Tax=Penicillium mononematosum TaxID=268346 RepID=UPI0025470F86|nr:uncharacterized protein N7519_004400 [Penicillium mononematosum]KAJ6189492.1 hypothetical protein N7519_004400 [Penicillium mononematosum]
MAFLYFVGGNYKLLIYGSERIYRQIIADVLLAEHALCELSQREETLHHRAMALQKTIDIESDRLQPDETTAAESTRAELEKTNQQLKEFQLQYARKEHSLYQAISMLTPYFKELYDNLRRDPKWTVRIEVDAAAGNVDAAHRGVKKRRIYHKGRKAEAIALQSVSAVSAFGASSFQRKIKRRLGEISKPGLNSGAQLTSSSWQIGLFVH